MINCYGQSYQRFEDDALTLGLTLSRHEQRSDTTVALDESGREVGRWRSARRLAPAFGVLTDNPAEYAAVAPSR